MVCLLCFLGLWRGPSGQGKSQRLQTSLVINPIIHAKSENREVRKDLGSFDKKMKRNLRLLDPREVTPKQHKCPTCCLIYESLGLEARIGISRDPMVLRGKKRVHDVQNGFRNRTLDQQFLALEKSLLLQADNHTYIYVAYIVRHVGCVRFDGNSALECIQFFVYHNPNDILMCVLPVVAL